MANVSLLRHARHTTHDETKNANSDLQKPDLSQAPAERPLINSVAPGDIFKHKTLSRKIHPNIIPPIAPLLRIGGPSAVPGGIRPIIVDPIKLRTREPGRGHVCYKINPGVPTITNSYPFTPIPRIAQMFRVQTPVPHPFPRQGHCSIRHIDLATKHGVVQILYEGRSWVQGHGAGRGGGGGKPGGHPVPGPGGGAQDHGLPLVREGKT